jgi:hypothetical protein
VPKRRVATDRAGLNPDAVEAATLARAGLEICQGWVSEPAHRDAAGRHRPASRRRCVLPLDPALTLAGFLTHPCCDPDERSASCPPMVWPTAMLKRPRKTKARATI